MITFKQVFKLSLFSLILFFAALYGYYLKSGQLHISEFCFAQNCFNVYSSPAIQRVPIKPPGNLSGNRFASRAKAVSGLSAQFMAMCQGDHACLEEINSVSPYDMLYLQEFVAWCNQDKQCREKYARNAALSVTPNLFLSWNTRQTWGKRQQSIRRWMHYIIGQINRRNQSDRGQDGSELSGFTNQHGTGKSVIKAPLLPETIDYVWLLKGDKGLPVFCGMTRQSVDTLSSGLRTWLSLPTDKKQLFIFNAATDELFLGQSLGYFARIFAVENSIFQQQWHQYCARPG